MVETSPHPPPSRKELLAGILQQLDANQWLPPEEIEANQFKLLEKLLTHAFEQIPRQRAALEEAGFAPGERLTPETFARLPILTREELQSAPESLKAHRIDPSRAPTREIQTTGSTGRPVTVTTNATNDLFWDAFTLREHLWQGRDFSLKLAAIRPDRGAALLPGITSENWGAPAALLYETGPASLLDSRTPVPEQAAWLIQENPDYLISLPSNLTALADHCRQEGIKIPGLKQVRCYAEVLNPKQRRAMEAAWGVPVADVYSAQETGYIALQCPDLPENMHVQSEGVRVEVLDDQGRPLPHGTPGRVVLTPLRNSAMPLIRYEINDWAVTAPPCPCGRGLPVLTRILGRERNMLKLPNGDSHWPSFPSSVWTAVAPIRQIRLRQTARDRVLAEYLMQRALTPEETETLRAGLAESLNFPHRIDFERREELPRHANGKYEDFIRECD